MWLSNSEIRVENGKAHVEFTFDFDTVIMEEQDQLQVTIYDEHMREVLICGHPLNRMQPVKGVLLHPHLWNSIQDPYCYTLHATLYRTEGAQCMVVERMEEILPIYTLQERGQKGWYLNDQPFSCRGVWYTELPQVKEELSSWVKRDIEEIQRLGANILYIEKEKMSESIRTFAYQKGLLLWAKEEETQVELILPEEFQTDNYYYHFASWSKEPFLHICLSTLQVNQDGTCSFTIYSNQKRVALYCDGVIFEFKTAPPEFYFEQVPMSNPLLLTVETKERTVSVSLYPR